MMRALRFCLLLALTGCGGDQRQDDIQPSGAWDVFIGSVSDELHGTPSAADLRERKRFSRAGVSFNYPALLRVRVDDDSYPSWEFSHRDFELELHAPDSAVSSEAYLDALVTAFEPDDDAAAGSGQPLKVEWCGTSITGVVRHMKIFGDHYRYQGFDLPDGEHGPRFLIFSDQLDNGHWSATAQATFDAVSASIQCTSPATPG